MYVLYRDVGIPRREAGPHCAAWAPGQHTLRHPRAPEREQPCPLHRNTLLYTLIKAFESQLQPQIPMLRTVSSLRSVLSSHSQSEGAPALQTLGLCLRQLHEPLNQAQHGAVAAPSPRWTSTHTHTTASSGGAEGKASHLHAQLEPLDSPNDGIFFLSLTRPEARNAIGRQLLRELRECLVNLSKERSTRCVVVRSTAPGVFCAGADLKERAAMTQQEAAQFVQDLRGTMSLLEELPMPTVAAVDGYALGGGAELALACDLRVCGRGAQFAFPETRLGIIPGAGGTQRLPRVVGRTRAKDLIFTGRGVDSHEALKIGLVDHAADAESCEEAALSLAREIAASGPVALRMAKAAINLGSETEIKTGLRIEEACYAQVLPTKDRLEGLKAFAEKRRPVFTGE